MKGINLIAVKKEEIEEVLKSFNLEVTSDGNVLKEGRYLECHTCGRRLTTKNVGHITSGSPALFFCDNPSCAIAYIRSK